MRLKTMRLKTMRLKTMRLKTMRLKTVKPKCESWERRFENSLTEKFIESGAGQLRWIVEKEQISLRDGAISVESIRFI